jgi:hypothetical protein
MTAPLRAAAVATALVGALALPAAVEAGHGRSHSYHGRVRSYGYARSYRPAIVVAPYYRYYPSPVYDPYYYAPAPYYDPYYAPYGYGYGYSSYRYSPYRRGYSYGYRHFHGGVACYLPHVRIGIGW